MILGENNQLDRERPFPLPEIFGIIWKVASVFDDTDDERGQFWIFVKKLTASNVIPCSSFFAHF